MQEVESTRKVKKFDKLQKENRCVHTVRAALQDKGKYFFQPNKIEPLNHFSTLENHKIRSFKQNGPNNYYF